MLRIFNMLTKSKISEARCSMFLICNHVEQRSCDTYHFCQEYLKTKPPTLSFQRFCKWRSHGKPDRSPKSTRKTSGFGDYLIIKTNHGHLVRGFVFAILKLHREICIIDTKHSCSEVVIMTTSEIIQIGNSMT